MEYDIVFPGELYEYEILKMTLQPLVENALYHGIKNKRRLGHIWISGEKDGDILKICVRDDGMGIRPEKLAYMNRVLGGEISDDNNSSGFGLFNVQQRIQLNYGLRYGLEIKSDYGEGTEVTVLIPAVKK